MEIIRETGYGCWVWEMPNGEFVAEGENYMMVFGTDKDHMAIKAITDAAHSYGFAGGRPKFWADVRPVTDEEHEMQVARMEAGLTPDIWDIAAIKDEMKAIKNNGY